MADTARSDATGSRRATAAHASRRPHGQELPLSLGALGVVHGDVGIAVACGTAGGVPDALLPHVKHNKVLHQQVVLLSMVTKTVPFVVDSSSFAVTGLGQGVHRVVSHPGFMQQPDVSKIPARRKRQGLTLHSVDTTSYLGRQTLLTTGASRIARPSKMRFSFLPRNARPPTPFFQPPPSRLVELGLQIEL